MIDIIDIVRYMSGSQFIALFWFWILFDFPRYVLSLIPVMIASPWKWRPVPANITSVENHVGISFILAGHNEADVLERTVQSLREQTLQDIEIIVVDDGSTDATPQIAGRLYREGKVDKVYSTGLRGGRAAALNLALRECKYEIIAYGDTDTTYDRNAFVNLLAAFNSPEVGAVSANLAIKNATDSVATRLQALEFLESIAIGRRFMDLFNILPIVSGGFGAFRKSALLMVGGWEPGTGEDADATEKLRRAGWRIRFAPYAWGLTSGPATFSGLLRQRLRWERDVVRIRLRKFRDNINPFSHRFILSNMLSAMDAIFFQIIIPSVFIIYISYLFIEFGIYAFIIIGVVNIFYMFEDLMNYTAIVILHGERDPIKFFPYIPLLSLYQWTFMRFLRLYAYLDELIFRTSARDEFVPRRVSSGLEQF